jgi:flagellar basal body rod protein FlgG
MTLTRHGQLVAASDGAPILGRGGSPIFLNPNGSRDRIAIDEDGRIFQDDLLAGQLELVDPGDFRALRKVGDLRFAAPDNVGRRAVARVHDGFVETSGVQPLQELVGMMEASRAYQMNAQMITLQDGTLGRLIGATLRV